MISNTEQSGINGKSPEPGTIPRRSPTLSELVHLKILCQDAKDKIGYVYSDLQTLNLGDGFDNAGEIMDEAGHLLDAISQFCQRSMKRIDEKKSGGIF